VTDGKPDTRTTEKKEGPFAGFKEFVLRGNVLDLAVAVVVGAAFTAVVNAIVKGIFNPAIGALFNAKSLSDALIWSIPTTSGGTAKILFGSVLGAILQFLIVAVVVYFVLVMPLNRLKRIAFAKQQQEATEADDAPLPPSEAELLLQIRDLLAAQADREVVPTTTGKHAVISPRTAD
jgi:large conductance mechanosensitive channel